MTMKTTTTIKALGLDFSSDLSGPENGGLVLFLHGFPQTRYTWRAELKALADKGYRCCAFDQRGYSAGARPAGIEAYRLEEMIADALAMADALGYERFHLVGHDWGGQIAWCVAALEPSRVATLAVISRPHPAAFIRALADDPAQSSRSGHHQRFQSLDAADDLLANDAATLRDMYVKWGGVPAADAEAYLTTLGERDALDAAINWYRAVRDTAVNIAELPAITVPTLYVWGTGDSTVGRMAAEGTQAMVAGPFEFAQLPDVGHFVTDEVPGVFTKRLLAHLKTHG
ncbi:MAG: alpha/beta hydrolase [Pseudomonadota bacterium]